jgi:vancomycin resistance protein YoaR
VAKETMKSAFRTAKLGLRERALLITLCVFLFLLVFSLIAFEVGYTGKIYPGVRVLGFDLGGFRPDVESLRLNHRLGLDKPAVALRGPEDTWHLKPSDLGMVLDEHRVVAAAYEIGRGDSFAKSVIERLRILVFGHEVPAVVSYDPEEARTHIEALAESIDLPPTDARLTFEGGVPTLVSAEDGRQLDVDASLALVTGVLGAMGPAEAELAVREIVPAVTRAEAALREAERLLNGPVTMTLENPREGDPGPWVIQPEQLVSMVEVVSVGSELQVLPSDESIAGYLEPIAQELAIDPVNARFRYSVEDNRLEVIESGTDGRALSIPLTVSRIIDALASSSTNSRFVPLVVERVAPTYASADDFDRIEEYVLVAEGDSYFIGSPSGRDNNIRVAAQAFDGVVVGPGEEFSFNHYLGEVSAEAGYDESYVTAGEQLAIEVGGGICQVSTTAFRAAFWGGYPIAERWHHNNRIGYYELRDAGVGMDATVYSPNVDFRFRNDREHPLIIQTEIEESTHRLAFLLYSVDDGRHVEAGEVQISGETEPGPPIYQLDTNLEPGEVTRWQSAVDGLTAKIQRTVVAAGGDILFENTFVSPYAPRRAAYRYGPGYEPPPDASTGTD